MTMTSEPLVAELWCREAVPAEIRSVQERFASRLHAAGGTGSVSVEQWGTYTYADSAVTDRSDCERVVAAIQRWADRVGSDLEPAFEIYEGSGIAEGESRTIVRLPITCLLLYDDELLREVTPCTVDGRTYTVADAITALETEPFDGTFPIAGYPDTR